MTHWQLGNQAEARKWYVKSIGSRGKSNNKEWLRFRNEARELLGMPIVVQHTDVVESVVFLPDRAGLWSVSSDETPVNSLTARAPGRQTNPTGLALKGR